MTDYLTKDKKERMVRKLNPKGIRYGWWNLKTGGTGSEVYGTQMSDQELVDRLACPMLVDEEEVRGVVEKWNRMHPRDWSYWVEKGD